MLFRQATEHTGHGYPQWRPGSAASTAAAIEEYRLDNEQYQREQSPLGATHARAQLRPRRENLSQERRAERATVRTEVYAAVVAKAIPAVWNPGRFRSCSRATGPALAGCDEAPPAARCHSAGSLGPDLNQSHRSLSVL